MIKALTPCPQARQKMNNSSLARDCRTVIEKHDVFESIYDLPEYIVSGLLHNHFGYEYLLAQEEGLDKTIDFRYVVTYRGTQAVCLSTFHILPFDLSVLGDYTNQKRSAWWKDIDYKIGRWVQQCAIRPRHRLLIAGDAFLSGAHAFSTSDKSITYLLAASEYLSASMPEVFMTLIKDIPSDQKFIQEKIKDEGYHGFEVEPLMRLRLSGFEDFDLFKNSMKSKYRQRLNSTIKKSAALKEINLDTLAISKYADELQVLLHEVIGSEKFTLSAPPPTYFSSLKQQMRDKFILKGYFFDEELVGFRASILGDGHLAAWCVGYKKELNHSLKVYQRMLIDFVQDGIEEDCDVLCLGRTANEIKSCIGAEAVDYQIFMKIKNPIFHRLVSPLVDRLPRTQWVQRRPFKILEP